MKRLAFLIVVVAGCTNNAKTNATWFAINPQTGVCTPLSGSVDHASVGSWQSCSDPCAGLDVRACKSDPRCQATYDIAGYRSCQAVPAPFDPCSTIDPAKCNDDSRCALQPTGGGCDCGPAGVVCNCPAAPPAACALKPCGDITDASTCNARPDCTTTAPLLVPTPVSSGGVSSGGVSSGTTQPRSSPTVQCFPLGSCNNSDENDCEKRHECVPYYDGQNHFGTCGSVGDCSTSADCAAGERCNGSHTCVVEGCGGDTETECNADPHCEPVYSLDCSPYANGGGGGTGGGPNSFCGGATGGGGSPSPLEAPAPGSCTCEPTLHELPAASGRLRSGQERARARSDDPRRSVLGAVARARPRHRRRPERRRRRAGWRNSAPPSPSTARR